jgi:dienelactone hydrolase
VIASAVLRRAHLPPVLALLLVAGSLGACLPENPSAASLERYGLHEEVLSIPAVIRDKTYRLEATLFRPSNVGRFPLIVINHGTQAGVSGREQHRYRVLDASAAFVHDGYAVVLPMRRGYAGSEGEQVRVHGYDLTNYGLENALDIKAAIEWLRAQEFVDDTRIAVVGQSTGGLATMAYLTMADPGVLCAVNIHGGVRPKDLTDDPLLDARIAAFTSYARQTHLPSVWIYAANDHSSRPPFIQRLHEAYQAAGGAAELHQLAAFKSDGHILFGDPDGRPLWFPVVEKFLLASHACTGC